jgi:hypothetical protein
MTRTVAHPHPLAGHGFMVAIGTQSVFGANDPASTFNIKDPLGGDKILKLRTRTYIAKNSVVNFGGLFEDLDLNVGSLHVFLLPNGGKAFYLQDVSLDYGDLSLGGLSLKGASVGIEGLTNHPDVYGKNGWFGTVKLGAESLLFSSIPELSLSAAKPGKDALSIGYNFATRSLELALSNLAYRSHQLDLSASGRLVIGSGVNSSSRLDFSGSGSLALSALGLPAISGELDVVVDDQKLKTIKLKVLVDAKQPIAPIGLSGSLEFQHDVLLEQGQIILSGARLFEIPIAGSLAYDSAGFRSALSIDTARPGSIDLGGLQVTPRSGRLGLNYFKNPQGVWGGDIKLSGVFDLGLSGLQVSFRGDVELSLDPSASPSLKSASLTLASDVDLAIGGFNLRLLSNDPVAPTKLSLVNSNGALVPSLSGKVAFSDLAGLQLTVPEGGISYGANGWAFNDVQLDLGQNLDLGPVRLGSQASAHYQNGKVTLNPDLSVNFDTFALGLKPIGQLVNDVVTPITAPIVKVFTTNIDLGSVAEVRDAMATLKSKTDIDLASAWSGLVGFLEDVPGNPYKDNVLSAGELLDFVSYRAFDFVQKNPGIANTAFKAVFNTDLPSWLLELPQGINYADLSMSATVARLDAINKLAASLLEPVTQDNRWVSVPMAIELAANSINPNLSGDDASRQALEAQLRQLSGGLQKLEQLSQNQAPAAVREVKTLPLKFGYGFSVPLYDDTVNTLLKLIGNKPFDVVRGDFSLSSGVELNLALPLAELATAFPPAYAVLKAIDARFDLRTGLGAQLALSLGLSSSAPSLLAIGKEIGGNFNQTPAALLKLFSGRDPVTGSALGLYVGQTPGTPMLQLSPYVQAGLGGGRFGVDGLAYGRVDGTIKVDLTSPDGSNRAYLSDVVTGLASLPGIKATGSLDGTVGLKVDTLVGGLEPKVIFPIVKDATLFNTAPQPQTLLAAVPDLQHAAFGINNPGSELFA